MTDDIAEAREDLAAAYRLADRYGLSEGICNHLTLAVPGRDDRFLLIPYGMHWSEVTASSLLVVDAEGNKVEGEGFIEPTAFYIHGAIHKARAEARCVMHTHMPYALALCMIEDGRLEFADQNACRFYGRVAYDDDFGGVVLDWDEANRIASALGGKDVLFMANHGVTVVGETVARAWERLYYLDRACRAQVIAMSTGRPLKRIPDAMAAAVSDSINNLTSGASANIERHFAAQKRLLDRDGADYRE
jgi:ribulose-5-phosphate 4-epimerase/fuculose-1-phosphate aldolase